VWLISENPRVGGSIPSLATSSTNLPVTPRRSLGSTSRFESGLADLYSLLDGLMNAIIDYYPGAKINASLFSRVVIDSASHIAGDLTRHNHCSGLQIVLRQSDAIR
jgi:hypothetical protein